jgi:hypothetical protein
MQFEKCFRLPLTPEAFCTSSLCVSCAIRNSGHGTVWRHGSNDIAIVLPVEDGLFRDNDGGAQYCGQQAYPAVVHSGFFRHLPSAQASAG